MSISVETLALAKKNTKQAVEEAVTSVYRYRGSVETFEDLPTSGQKVGDVYNVEKEAGRNYARDGNDWDALGIAENLGDIEFTDSEGNIKTINEDFWDKDKVQEELDDISNNLSNTSNALNNSINEVSNVANSAYESASNANNALGNLGNVEWQEDKGNIKTRDWADSNDTFVYNTIKRFKGIDIEDMIAYDENYPDDTNIPFAIFECDNLEESGITKDSKWKVGFSEGIGYSYSNTDSTVYSGSGPLMFTRIGDTNKFTVYNVKNDWKNSFDSFKQNYLNGDNRYKYWSWTPHITVTDYGSNPRTYDLTGVLTYYSKDKIIKTHTIQNDIDNINNNFKQYMPKEQIEQKINNTSNDVLNQAKSYTNSKFDISMKKEVVQKLPTENIDKNTIYLVPTSNSSNENTYDEYLYVEKTIETDWVSEVNPSWTYKDILDQNQYDKLYFRNNHNINKLCLYEYGYKKYLDVTNYLTNGQPVDISEYDNLRFWDLQYGVGPSGWGFDYKFTGTTYDWELIGSTTTDLNNYYNKTQIDTMRELDGRAIEYAANTATNAYDTANTATNLAQAAYDAANVAGAAWQEISNVTTNETTNSVILPIDKEYDKYLITFNRPAKHDGPDILNAFTNENPVFYAYLGNTNLQTDLSIYPTLESYYKIEHVIQDEYIVTGVSRNNLKGSPQKDFKEELTTINDITNSGVYFNTLNGEIEEGITMTVYGKGEIVE